VVPSTWLSVLLFLLLVAPGLLFDLLAERRRVGATESAFREVNRVVLSSLAFSGLGFVVVVLARLIAPGSMPDFRRLVSEGMKYVATEYPVVIGAMGLELMVALAAALVTHIVLSPKSSGRLRPISTWQKVIREDCPKGKIPHARVRLTDGAVYVGMIGAYTADLDLSDRELVLVPPLFSKTGEKTLTAIPSEWQRVIIHGSAIESIALQYRSSTPARE
jgi:Family of unknown function (DUF6338)